MAKASGVSAHSGTEEPPPPTSFEPGSPFGNLLGRTIELTSLDFLLGFPLKDFNTSELAREADLSRPSASEVIEKFVEWGILEPVGRHGNSSRFRLNPHSHHVEAMMELIAATNERLFHLSRWAAQSRSGVSLSVRAVANSSAASTRRLALVGSAISFQEEGSGTSAPAVA
jgi:hypothetical protein